MLSRAANKTKTKPMGGDDNGISEDGDEVMSDQPQEEQKENSQGGGDGVQEELQQQQQQQVEEETMPTRWERDVEKERDKLLGFFIFYEYSIPRDIFHLIMSFVPAFPYYFTLRSVCTQWLYEFEEQLYSGVEKLDLLQTGKPQYYFRGDQLVQYKPLFFCGRTYPIAQIEKNSHYSVAYDQSPIFDFLGRIFCNVKHLRLTYGAALQHGIFSQCVSFILPHMKSLETLDIVGSCISLVYRSYTEELEKQQVRMLLDVLPVTVKTLSISNVTISRSTLHEFKTWIVKNQDLEEDERYKIENLLFERCVVQNGWFHSGETLQSIICDLRGLLPNVKVSVVEEACTTNVDLSEIFVVPKLECFKHLVEKDGLTFSHLTHHSYLSLDSVEYSECVMRALVNEHEQFRALIKYRENQTREMPYFQEKAYTLPGIDFFSSNFIYSAEIIEHIVRFWTDINKVKFPELILDMNKEHGGKTFVSALIPCCRSSEKTSFLKMLFEEFGAKFAVNGTRNYLLEACAKSHEDVINYFLEKCPKLVTLGNREGLIDGDVEELSLVHLCIYTELRERSARTLPLMIVERLLGYGAPFTHLDASGNTLMHLAASMRSAEFINLLVKHGHKDMIYQKNDFRQTPVECILNQGRSAHYEISPIDILEKLVDASGDPDLIKNCPTSDGTLLHTIMRSNSYDDSLVSFLLKNGVDINARNSKGATALFYIRSSEFNSENLSYSYRYRYRYYGYSSSDDHYFDEDARKLINLGADPELSDHNGVNSIMHALSHMNFKFVNLFISDPELSKKFDVAKSFKARTTDGLNALHFLFKALDTLLGWAPTMNKKQKIFQKGPYVVIRKCIEMCLKQDPEMLFERSNHQQENSDDDITPKPSAPVHHSVFYSPIESPEKTNIENLLGISPLQFILEATNALQIMKDVGIKISDIANRPVHNKPANSSQDESHIPIPAMYMALEVAIDVPLFDKILQATKDVFVRDLSQNVRPNLLHLAAERDVEMCKCVIKHWKKTHKKKDELTVVINQTLDNDGTDGKKPRTAAIIAAACGEVNTFNLLWPYARSSQSTMDSPIDVAIENGQHSFAFRTCILQHGILPKSRSLLISLTRRHFCIEEGLATASLLDVMRRMDEEDIDTEAGSWIELFLKKPEEENTEEHETYRSLNLLQIAVLGGRDSLVHWIATSHSNDPRVIHNFTNPVLKDGGTLLHLLFPAGSSHTQHDRRSILLNCLSFFAEDGSIVGASDKKQPGRVAAKKRTIASDLNLEKVREFINRTDDSGNSCVHYAIKNKYDMLLMDLLDCGADLNLVNGQGCSPLSYANEDTKSRVEARQDELAGKKPRKRKTRPEPTSSDEDDVQDSDYDSDPKPKKRKRSTRAKRRKN